MELLEEDRPRGREVATERHFRSPVRVEDIGPAVMAVRKDNRSPSGSEILMQKSGQSYHGPTAWDTYVNNHSRPMKHEMMHVLQNIDGQPFDDAYDKLKGPWAKHQSRTVLQDYAPGYGGVDELSAYLLSQTGDLTKNIRNTRGMSNPEYNNPKTLADLLMANFSTVPGGIKRRYADLETRKDYMSELPAGLRQIIDSITGIK